MVSRRLQQVSTHNVSLQTIMRQPTFALGVTDARNGKPYRPAYDDWGTNAQWDYERGRAFATVAPRDLSLKLNGRINAAALAYADDIL